MRIEQRIGRVHRIGEDHPVDVVNLCLAGSIEERILKILDERIHLFELVVGEVEMILAAPGRRRPRPLPRLLRRVAGPPRRRPRRPDRRAPPRTDRAVVRPPRSGAACGGLVGRLRAQQPACEKGLHVPSLVGDQHDHHVVVQHAVDNSMRFHHHLPVIANPEGE
jgi:hypothetical protein